MLFLVLLLLFSHPNVLDLFNFEWRVDKRALFAMFLNVCVAIFWCDVSEICQVIILVWNILMKYIDYISKSGPSEIFSQRTTTTTKSVCAPSFVQECSYIFTKAEEWGFCQRYTSVWRNIACRGWFSFKVSWFFALLVAYKKLYWNFDTSIMFRFLQLPTTMVKCLLFFFFSYLPSAGLMLVAFSSIARIFGECSIIHLPPALFFFFFLRWRLARAH